MERPLLEKILESTDGIARGDGGKFEVAEEHRASLYLGGQSGTTLVGELTGFTLHDEYVEAHAKNRTTHCITYGPIFGLSVKRPPKGGPRTGF